MGAVVKTLDGITADQVRAVLDYRDGHLWWRHPKQGRRLSKPAGGVDENGYGIICIDGIRYKTHRLVWLYVYGVWPDGLVDHIDGNPSNNDVSNLREASQSENLRNRGAQSNNKSGFKGVCWDSRKKRWLSQIAINGKNKHLGYFQTVEEAHSAYCRGSTKYHGDFGATK